MQEFIESIKEVGLTHYRSSRRLKKAWKALEFIPIGNDTFSIHYSDTKAGKKIARKFITFYKMVLEGLTLLLEKRKNENKS